MIAEIRIDNLLLLNFMFSPTIKPKGSVIQNDIFSFYLNQLLRLNYVSTICSLMSKDLKISMYSCGIPLSVIIISILSSGKIE